MTATNRLWIIGLATITVVLLVAGWFIGIQPLLTAAAAADAERSSIETLNDAKALSIAQLAIDNENIDELEEEYSALKRSIPNTKGSAAFISGLDGLASQSGVRIEAITLGDAQAYTVPASAAVVAAPDPAETTDEAEADAAPPAPAEPVGAVAVTNSLITPSNFVGVAVTVNVLGSYDAVLNFVNGMQMGDRLFLLTAFTSSTNADTADVTATVTGMIYVLKQPQ